MGEKEGNGDIYMVRDRREGEEWIAEKEAIDSERERERWERKRERWRHIYGER